MKRRSRRTAAKPRAPTADAAFDRAIVDAALAEAERGGWDALRLRRVAAAAGTDLAALVTRFPSADAIADAWLDRATVAMAAGAPALAGLAPPARLEGAIFAWLGALAPHRRVARAILLGKLYPGHPHLVAGLVVRVSRTVQLLRDAAGLDAPPPRRQLEEIALTWLFAAIVARWAADASEEQRATRDFARRALAGLDRLAGAASRMGAWAWAQRRA